MNIKGILADNKNIEILKLLQQNPRMSIAELARKIGMSNPAAKERVRRLEKSGVIAGYRLELDPKAAGHEITAFVRIRPLPGHLPKISALAQQIPEVVECHRVTGEDCFILKVHLPEIASLDRVLEAAVAFIRRTGRRREADRGRLRLRAGNHERLFLSRNRQTAASDGRND